MLAICIPSPFLYNGTYRDFTRGARCIRARLLWLGEHRLCALLSRARSISCLHCHAGACCSGLHGRRVECYPRSIDSTCLNLRLYWVPASEHIVHRFGDIAVARELAIFRAQPGLKLRYQRRDERAAHREALVNGTAVDLSLDVEDRIDALHRFEGKRRDDRELAALWLSRRRARRTCGDRAPSSSPR